jgi:hypothetical protein
METIASQQQQEGSLLLCVGNHFGSCKSLLVPNRSEDGQKESEDYKMDPSEEKGQ